VKGYTLLNALVSDMSAEAQNQHTPEGRLLGPPARSSAWLHDPICGMPVDPCGARSGHYQDQVFYFCSDFCRQEFFRRHAAAGTQVHEAKGNRRVAYFSMEIAVDPRMPTYAGGLGVLAGDTLRSCADLRVPIVAVTLLDRKGYFEQHIDALGRQIERPVAWSPEQMLLRQPEMVSVEIERRKVQVQAWKYTLLGNDGYAVPVLFLDTDVAGNADDDRHLTDYLYGGDERYRLAQEIILGMGGVQLLKALGYDGIQMLHLNEGHASLAALELLIERHRQKPDWDFQAVRERCVFTTHTPVPAANDQFDYELVHRVLGNPIPSDVLVMLAGQQKMNMTLLGLNMSHFVNGVARKHSEISEHLYPGRDIRHITNGIHSVTWVSDSFRTLYDRHIPGWQEDPSMLRKAVSIPQEDIWSAHLEAKAALLSLVKQRMDKELRRDALTIGIARRSTAYKRTDLVFSDIQRLRRIGSDKVQLVFSGKAHPKDEAGKDLIRRIIDFGRQLGQELPVIYLPNYDLDLARCIVSGVDLWLNTPLRPLEASGTSGMKAALNGVPSLSILDGWWIEGWIEGITGWAIGKESVPPEAPAADSEDADELYRKLEEVVIPTFFNERVRWTSIMQHCIALNASFFNSHRMVQQYVTNAYAA
jgi:starch phosphorylase